MAAESTGRKIWNVIYPVITLFALYFGVVYGGVLFFSSSSCFSFATLDGFMEKYFALITVIALIIIIIVEYIFFRNDHVVQPTVLIKKPLMIVLLLILGAACSHGLNILISLFNINGIFDSYEAVETEIFAPGVVLVIIRALILAPIAEELVFRGLVFRRLKNYSNFWVAALVSSALFGLYHMNLGQGIYAFLFGILLCAVYSKFDHLLAPILLHFAANALSVILTYTGADYPSTAAYIISMVVMFALTAGICIFMFRKKSD